MKQYTNQTISGQPQVEIGASIMTYSDYGQGKTHALGTLPEPIAIINKEPRDPRLVLSWCKKKITFYEPTDFDEEEDLFNQMESAAEKGKLPFKGIGYDSLSFVQSLSKIGLEDDRYERNKLKDEHLIEKGLVGKFSIDESDWGRMASMMKRRTASLNRLSKYGIVVVANATMIENPRWNRALKAAPAFQGKEFPAVVNGYFDFIFFIIEPFEFLSNGKSKPPTISFHSSNGDYIAKCCNEKLLRAGTGPLDYGRLIRVIRGENGRKEVVTEGSKVESSSSREKEKEILENSPFE